MPYDSISQVDDFFQTSPPDSPGAELSDEETDETRAERAARLYAIG